MIEYLIQILCAGISSFGFAALYNTHGKRLVIPFIGGIAGWSLYLALNFLNSTTIQTFICVLFLSVYTEIAARIVKTPTTTFLVPNVIILMPGGSLYFTISSAIKGEWVSFASYGKSTIYVAFSIAAGIMIISSVTKIIYRLNNS